MVDKSEKAARRKQFPYCFFEKKLTLCKRACRDLKVNNNSAYQAETSA
jgi:hypothetical protein